MSFLAQQLMALHVYGPERRRAARLKVAPERRQEISRRGGAARAAQLGPEGLAAMGRLGAAAAIAGVPAEARRERSARGARALNARTPKRLKRAWVRKAGANSRARRLELGIVKGGRIASMNLLSENFLRVLGKMERGRRYTGKQIAAMAFLSDHQGFQLAQRLVRAGHVVRHGRRRLYEYGLADA